METESVALQPGDLRSLSSLRRALPWLRISGWASLLVGVVASFPLVTIALTWIPIWVGFRALRAERAIRRALDLECQSSIEMGMREISSLLRVSGILALIGFVGCLLTFVGVLLVAFVTSMGY